MKKRITFLSIIVALALGITCFSVISNNGIAKAAEIARQADAEFTLSVSSTLADDSHKSSNLTDGKSDTCWYSQWADEKNPVCSEWILLDFGSVRKIESITLTPNANRICFPSDFTFAWGVTGDKLVNIAGFEFTDYKLSDTAEVETFAINAVTRYVRINITRRNKNPDGNYLVSFAEVTAAVIDATQEEIAAAVNADAAFERLPVVDDPIIHSTATASSFNSPVKDWGVDNVNDGLLSTQWAAEWGSGVTEEECDEWIVLTFDTPSYCRGVSIRSQLPAHNGFPKSFYFEWTLDGQGFFKIDGASYTDEPIDDTLHIKVFDTPVTATAIRMVITSSYSDSQGNYLPQIAEFQVHGREATETEVAAATTLFNRLSGVSETKDANTSGIAPYLVGGSFMLAFSIVFLGVAVGVLLWIILGKKSNARKAAATAKEQQITVSEEENIDDGEK